MHDTAPATEAAAWLAMFSDALSRRDIAATLELFAEDCYWRDLVAFTWNVKTMEGKAAIAEMLQATLEATAPSAWQVTKASGIALASTSRSGSASGPPWGRGRASSRSNAASAAPS